MNWFLMFCMLFVILHDPVRRFLLTRKYKKGKYFIPTISGNDQKFVTWHKVEIRNIYEGEYGELYFDVKYNHIFNVVKKYRLFESMPVSYSLEDPAFKHYW